MKEKILELQRQGLKNKEIAELLGKTPSTISYYTSPGYKERNLANQQRRRSGLKDEAVALKGGKCQICSYDKCLGALDFHHLNPKEKDPMLKTSALTHMSKAAILRELEKCILVCCRCHKEIHMGLINLESYEGIAPSSTVLQTVA